MTQLEGEALLDLGCGDGSYTLLLSEGFRHVVAIDPESERLEVFRQHVGKDPKFDLKQMFSENLELPSERFDVVTAIEVLEHVGDVDQTLNEVHRVLRPGGRFCLTTPNRLFPIESHGFSLRGRRYPPAAAPFLTWVPPLHRRLSDSRAFTEGQLVRHIERAGLEVKGATVLMPPFDRRSGLQGLADRLERTPLSRFGLTHAVTAIKGS